jgi:hypothetical protein
LATRASFEWWNCFPLSPIADRWQTQTDINHAWKTFRALQAAFDEDYPRGTAYAASADQISLR